MRKGTQLPFGRTQSTENECRKGISVVKALTMIMMIRKETYVTNNIVL